MDELTIIISDPTLGSRQEVTLDSAVTGIDDALAGYLIGWVRAAALATGSNRVAITIHSDQEDPVVDALRLYANPDGYAAEYGHTDLGAGDMGARARSALGLLLGRESSPLSPNHPQCGDNERREADSRLLSFVAVQIVAPDRTSGLTSGTDRRAVIAYLLDELVPRVLAASAAGESLEATITVTAPPAPVFITGPGWYRTQEGERVELVARLQRSTQWSGWSAWSQSNHWNEDGTSGNGNPLWTLVAKEEGDQDATPGG